MEPASAEDVSLILTSVVEAGCHFAIKSGGHARAAGFSNADGGVTIDLIRLGSVELSSDKKSVKVGAGARWLDVYSDVEKANLGVVGGRVADVGVGGLTLGGGISFWSARHGWACDSVLSYEIVLPDSTVATVSPASHQDLYWALRGAGQSNFGVVTSFTYETFPLPNPAGLWDANKIYSWDKVPEVIPAWHKIHTETIYEDPDIGGFNVYIYFQAYDQWWIVDRYIHTTHSNAATWPDIFAPLEAIEGIPDTTTTVIQPYSNITIHVATQSPFGSRNIYATFTFKPSIELTHRIVAIFREEAEKLTKIEEILPCLILQPFTSLAMSHMSKNGGNALGLSEEDGPLVVLNLAWKWIHASDDEFVYGVYHKFMERAESAAKEMGLWHRFKYANYAEESKDVWSGYGEENLQRLKKIQREVDAMGVFTKGGLAGSGYKLNVKGDGATAEGRKLSGKSEL